MKVSSCPFGEVEGREVLKFTLANNSGVRVEVITYGGIITAFEVPDREGHPKNIVLGFNSLPEYWTDKSFPGAIIGRCCNRIAYGRFQLNGQPCQLPVNLPPHHLHGGMKGFAKRLWEPEVIHREGQECLKLKYLSPHGEEGYPGNLKVEVTYSLNENNELSMGCHGQSDADTLINLTNHSYFNLNGHDALTCLDHELQWTTEHFVPVDETLIPVGNLRSTKNTPFDFSAFALIGDKMQMTDPQIQIGQGYDHHLVKDGSTKPVQCVTVRHPVSGIQLRVGTTQPGFQFYTGNFLEDSSGGKFRNHQGFCIETQHFPDAINQVNFPSPILRAGEIYKEETVFKVEQYSRSPA